MGPTARTDFIGPSLSVIYVTGLSRIHEVNVIYVYFYMTSLETVQSGAKLPHSYGPIHIVNAAVIV